MVGMNGAARLGAYAPPISPATERLTRSKPHFDIDGALREHKETSSLSDSLRKAKKTRLQKAKADDPAPLRACDARSETRCTDAHRKRSRTQQTQGKSKRAKSMQTQGKGKRDLQMCSALGEEELRVDFPLLFNLPDELQLLVATHVAAPRDRAALCIAVPPLGRKAIKAYKGPLMSLGNRVLSGGAVGEAEVRRYVRELAPSEAAHPPLALNEYAQLNAMAAPSVRVRCVVQGSSLEWRLERHGAGGFQHGALLRCWKPLP